MDPPVAPELPPVVDPALVPDGAEPDAPVDPDTPILVPDALPEVEVAPDAPLDIAGLPLAPLPEPLEEPEPPLVEGVPASDPRPELGPQFVALEGVELQPTPRATPTTMLVHRSVRTTRGEATAIGLRCQELNMVRRTRKGRTTRVYGATGPRTRANLD
jgi:hypothetical protein